jgi:ribosomal protein S18 acetylase RimI-like enzyme
LAAAGGLRLMVTYRNAGAQDAALMAALGRRTFTETFGHLYTPENLAAFLESHNEGDWGGELENQAFRVRIAEDEGEAVGYAKLGPPSLPFQPEGSAIELRQFYVLKPWQGQGAAQALMEWVLEQAKVSGADELYLSVFVDNHRARRFYERYGFRFVAPYVFMVGSHEDEDHILRLDLKGA